MVACVKRVAPSVLDTSIYPQPVEIEFMGITAYPAPDTTKSAQTTYIAQPTPTTDNLPMAVSDEIKNTAKEFFTHYKRYAIFIDDATFSPHFEYYGCVDSDNKAMVISYVANQPLDAIRLSAENFFQNEQWNYQERQQIGDGSYNGIMWFFSAQPKTDDNEGIFVEISVLEYSSIAPADIKSGTPNPKLSDMRVSVKYLPNSRDYNPEADNKDAELVNTCNGKWWLTINP
jgi:hypothetical protein